MPFLGFILISFAVICLTAYYSTDKPQRRFIRGMPWFNWPLLAWSLFWTFVWPLIERNN